MEVVGYFDMINALRGHIDNLTWRMVMPKLLHWSCRFVNQLTRGIAWSLKS